MDVIFPGGLSSAVAANAGFVILDRGTDKGHDPFRIAAITSLNGSGDPASFGSVKTCTGGNGSSNGSWGHPSSANGNRTLPVYVLRKDPSADAHIRVSAAINQEIGGVMFTFADLGVAANQVIYGYTLIGPDGTANPSSSQLLNTSNSSVYPTGTLETDGGGLDLISVNTVFSTGGNVLLPVQLLSFSGTGHNGNASLEWQLTAGIADRMVELERSEDGLSFSRVYSSAIPETAPKMSFEDKTEPGTWYYRLKIIQTSGGAFQYSPVQAISVSAHTGWRVFPTRAARTEKLQVEGLPDGFYSAGFYSLSGSVSRTNISVQHNKAVIEQPAGLAPGVYMLHLSDGKSSPKSVKLFIY
ncbi:MAG: hypothetical protein JST39_10535 [Bacteroidetes bacterium]|nr:hypothetical protein [Bacteroidota bacterium]